MMQLFLSLLLLLFICTLCLCDDINYTLRCARNFQLLFYWRKRFSALCFWGVKTIWRYLCSSINYWSSFLDSFNVCLMYSTFNAAATAAAAVAHIDHLCICYLFCSLFAHRIRITFRVNYMINIRIAFDTLNVNRIAGVFLCVCIWLFGLNVFSPAGNVDHRHHHHSVARIHTHTHTLNTCVFMCSRNRIPLCKCKQFHSHFLPFSSSLFSIHRWIGLLQHDDTAVVQHFFTIYICCSSMKFQIVKLELYLVMFWSLLPLVCIILFKGCFFFFFPSSSTYIRRELIALVSGFNFTVIHAKRFANDTYRFIDTK